MTWRWWADFCECAAIAYGLLMIGLCMGLFVITADALFFVVVILVMVHLVCLSIANTKGE